MPTLPPNASQFSLSVVGDRTDETYRADFITTKILSHRQQLLSDQLFREYVGGVNPQFASPEARDRAQILADINSALLRPIPQFWIEKGMGLDLLDNNVVTEVWNGVLKAQVDAADSIKKKAERAADRLKTAIEKGVDEEAKAQEAAGE